jgi:chemotaxis family two-component system response regulator Rcp1
MVDDDLDDVYLTRLALAAAEREVNLHVAHDGVEALRFLRGQDEFAGSRRPNLILLDLNLPGISGREVLAHLKADPALADIPVVILSTARAGDAAADGHAGDADGFVSKPVDINEFRAVVSSIESLWLAGRPR